MRLDDRHIHEARTPGRTCDSFQALCVYLGRKHMPGRPDSARELDGIAAAAGSDIGDAAACGQTKDIGEACRFLAGFWTARWLSAELRVASRLSFADWIGVKMSDSHASR